MEPLRVLVIYFSQTGQTRALAESLLSRAVAAGGVEVTYCQYHTVPDFPFPWTTKEFFGAFPETVTGETRPVTGIKPLIEGEYQLIILGWQPWYLTLSVPVRSMLAESSIFTSFGQTPLITLTGCRNMWVDAYEDLVLRFRGLGINHVGNIVTADRHHNLVSAFTIVRWLIRGLKPAQGIFPEAGVSEHDCTRMHTFWPLIAHSLQTHTLDNLQALLSDAGAVIVQPAMVSIERKGRRIFRIWASLIAKRRKNVRNLLLTCFKYYLYFAIFAISPIVEGLFWLIYPFRSRKIKRRTRGLKHLLGK